MDLESTWVIGKAFGETVRGLILEGANAIVASHWPGLISAGLVLVCAVCMLIVGVNSVSRLRAISFASSSLSRAGSGETVDVNMLERELSMRGGGPAKRLSEAFSEFRETLLEPSEQDDRPLRNAIRPSLFLNVDDLRFSLKGWRFAPSVFVSVGLLLTFLGLVAVLNSTQTMLDPKDTTTALGTLLKQASAKFTMSLTGLACSIVLNLWLKIWSRNVDLGIERLASKLERKVVFISLEKIADDQLQEIKKQTSDMHELNTNLIAALSEPLKKVSESSMENVGTMVAQLSSDITAGIGGSMQTVSERIEEAASSLSSIGENLTSAAQRFEQAMSSSTHSLETTLTRLEEVSDRLTLASETVGELAPTVLETLKEGNNANLRVAEGATEMVHAAKNAISEEKIVVLEAMASIKDLIGAFESRAAAYDGKLEEAFKTYQLEVGKTIDRLDEHGHGVQERFANSLSVLQGVIDNAKAFEPESTTNPVPVDADQ